jgi:hypothetical protein
LEESKSSYSENAVQDLELTCSLDDFIKHFISNEAKSSLTNYMAENGDHNINSSEWKANEEDGGFTTTRTIEYTHPVDAPMAPPMAKARKEQSYRKYGDHGLVLETKTYVSDVPMTDCFYVADLVRVESKSTENGEKKVVVHMLFDIRFVKSTMFQSIIQRTTKSELQKFLTSYSQFLSRNLGDVPGVVKETSATVPAPGSPSPSVSNLWSQIAIVILTVVILLQLWILRDIRLIKSEIKHMVDANVQLQTERLASYEQAQLHQQQSGERSTNRIGEL